MTAEAARARLERLQPFERSGMRPGLARIERLLDRLGHPERALRFLHVGGTNGKGSVSALAERIFRAAGLRTGLYTSPHLLDLAERIRLDGTPIDAGALARQVDRLGEALEGVSFFEAMTAVGFGAFREAAVDVAVIEVGLGGRWDATNVGVPLATVLTHIDYDHQEYLGHRLEEIAAEKAAIVRHPRGTVLCAAQAPEALAVIEARCRALGVPLLAAGRDLHAEVESANPRGQRVRLRGPGWELRGLDLALLGLFQSANAALAVGAVRVTASAAGWAVPDAAVRAGCAAVRWPGRFQVIARPGRPTIVLDGAHNPGGAAALAASLARYFPGAQLTLVLGISADKDRAGILKTLAPRASRLVLTAARHPRATPPAELAAALPPLDARVTVAADVGGALGAALSDPAAEVVCVAGSLFLVAEALARLHATGDVDPQGA